MFNYKRIILIVSIILFSSCGSTKIVEVPVEVVKTQYINNIQHDSVYINTSTEISSKNDTIFQTMIQYKYKYKYLKDTICIRDTIPKIVTVEKVEYINKLTQTQKVFYWIGIIVSIILIPIVFYKIKQIKL